MREKSVLRYGSMTVLMPSTVPLLIAQSVSECAKSRRPEGPPEARRTSSSLKGTSLMYAMRAAPALGRRAGAPGDAALPELPEVYLLPGQVGGLPEYLLEPLAREVPVGLPGRLDVGIVAGQLDQQPRLPALPPVRGVYANGHGVPARYVQRVRYVRRLGLRPRHQQHAVEPFGLVVESPPLTPGGLSPDGARRHAPVHVG